MITVAGLGSSGQAVSNGSYSVRLTAASQALDCYDIQVTSSPPNGGLGSFSFARFTVTSGNGSNPVGPGALPDLVPTAITFPGSDAGPSVPAGLPIHLDAGLVNQGAVPTGVFNIRWLVDDRDVSPPAYGSHESVPAHTTVLDGNSQFDWTPTVSGTHTIAFIVDVDRHVAEADESNNSTTLQLSVTGGAQEPQSPEPEGPLPAPEEPDTEPAPEQDEAPESPATRAATFCWDAIVNALQDELIDSALRQVLPAGAELYSATQKGKSTVEILYYAENGQLANAEFELAALVTRIAAGIPGTRLFGIIGTPAVYCLEAAFWYTGELGARFGAGLRALLLRAYAASRSA